MKSIFIYYDRGVSQESYQETLNMCQRFNKKNLLNIRTVSAENINDEPSWEEKVNCLIIPGGRETPYYEDLHQKGYQRIKHFVASGGNYLGICAGAYFGASRIVFEKGHPDNEIITERSLGLYSGVAEGPAYGLGRFEYNSEVGSRIAVIEMVEFFEVGHLTDSQKRASMPSTLPSSESRRSSNQLNDRPQKTAFQTYFNGGCWFHSHSNNNNTNIIARYADIPEKPAAIIACDYGKGKVYLSGVHFEYALDDGHQKNRDSFIREYLPVLK